MSNPSLLFQPEHPIWRLFSLIWQDHENLALTVALLAVLGLILVAGRKV